jgi:RNA polymerase sigma-70 factor (ECF subfamily)
VTHDPQVPPAEPTLDELLSLHWSPLVAYAHRLLDDVASAEDVVQHAFVRLWESRRAMPAGDGAQALLYRVVRNLAFNERRRHRTRDNWTAEQWVDEPEVMLADTLLEQKELRKAIEAAVEQLPPRRREIFVLSRFHQLSNLEISAVLAISPQTVANQLVSAMRTLRHLLGPHLEQHSYPPLKVVRDETLRTG